jgi:hypothetical protein
MFGQMKVEDLDNIRMAQRCDQLRLTQEARYEVWIGREIRVQEFYSDWAAQSSIPGLPDLRHAAATESLLQFVLPHASWHVAHT